MVDRYSQKKEAEKRLKMLNLHPDVLKLFHEEDKLYYSEATPIGGILYWMDNNPEWVKMISELEEKKGIMVYHATHEYLSFGECLSLLYVTKYENDWEYDRKEIEGKGEKYPLAYVINLSNSELSEFGTVVIREASGGLIRVA